MQCPICLDQIKNSCIGSCVHHFCYSCLIDWCKINNTCPKCKEIINEIRFDPEFDSINSTLESDYIDVRLDENRKVLQLSCFVNLSVGITLVNNSHGPGVRIKKIKKNLIADKCGFEVGDVILFINRIPCVNHAQTISIIDNLLISRKNVICILL